MWKSFNAEHDNNYHWLMIVDLDRCNGCGACVMACQAENNNPVVGEKHAGNNRAMHWRRIERYFEGEWPNLKVSFLPMHCQHCDKAPCEPVCPVFASYHNPEGVSVVVYNRCTGTRFCANNCPYSARGFNWFDYSWEEPLNEQLNPDVTVRERGVTEKCSFCTQRIRRGKDKAKDEGREVQDGDITPACAQVCPTNAISFGNVNDHNSSVAHMAESPRGVQLLEEHGTHPSVIYLKGGIEHAV